LINKMSRWILQHYVQDGAWIESGVAETAISLKRAAARSIFELALHPLEGF
jgi:hypothetical protein